MEQRLGNWGGGVGTSSADENHLLECVVFWCVAAKGMVNRMRDYEAGLPTFVKLNRLAIAVGAALENREKWGVWFKELETSYLVYEFMPVIDLLSGKVGPTPENVRRSKSRLNLSDKSAKTIVEQCFIYTIIDNLEYQLTALERSFKLTKDVDIQTQLIAQMGPIKERLIELREMLDIRD